MINQSKRFEELLEDMKKIHDKKRHDYANEDDIFAMRKFKKKVD